MPAAQQLPNQPFVWRIVPRRAGRPSVSWTAFHLQSRLPQLPQLVHRQSNERTRHKVEKPVGTNCKAKSYAPNCSVSLLSNLFKSLSTLRASSILSTECSTVV